MVAYRFGSPHYQTQFLWCHKRFEVCVVSKKYFKLQFFTTDCKCNFIQMKCNSDSEMQCDFIGNANSNSFMYLLSCPNWPGNNGRV